MECKKKIILRGKHAFGCAALQSKLAGRMLLQGTRFELLSHMLHRKGSMHSQQGCTQPAGHCKPGAAMDNITITFTQGREPWAQPATCAD
eukprot:1161030-Pelagomonas_calceolata.AAC.3